MIIFTSGPSNKKFINRKYKTEHYYVDKPHTKENIDSLNPWYCELTGLYYLYKNVTTSEVFGLDQYRKAFNINEAEMTEKLNKYDIIVHRTGLEPNTRLWHLDRGFGFGGLKNEVFHVYCALRYICPSCVKSYMKALNAKQSCQHNMFVGNAEIFNLYCSWLFSILNEYTEVYDIYKAPRRCIGHIIELTGLDTFIDHYKLNAYNAPIIIGG